MVKHTLCIQIIEKYFSGYPILVSPVAIEALVSAYNLSTEELDSILEDLRNNILFFEAKDATRYGLFNLLYYALNALYVPEQRWNLQRVQVTKEYRDMLGKKNPVRRGNSR